MEKFIPKDKMSKKTKLKLAKEQRKTWGALNPVTRKPANYKAYNRKKTRNEGDSFDCGSLFLCGLPALTAIAAA